MKELLATGVAWPGVTAEQRNVGVLTPMTGVACADDIQVVEATARTGFD